MPHSLVLYSFKTVFPHDNNFFYSIAYLAGLLLTIFIMHVYKHAQPALLYLVPACLGRKSNGDHNVFLIYSCTGVPLFLALVRGDIKTMFQYEDHPDLEAEKKKEK